MPAYPNPYAPRQPIYNAFPSIPTTPPPDPNNPTRQTSGVGGSSYPVSPSPQTYDPIFGGIPGNISLPNPFQDLSNAVPGLSGLNSQASGDLSAQFSGQLSPSTINMIQDQAAQWGAGAGMPGFQAGSLGGNLGLRNLGLSAEQQIQNAFNNYSKFIPTASATQTVPPALQAEIATLNSYLNAAPNPAAAGNHAQDLFNNYLRSLRGPGGGTGGGFGSPVGGPPSTGDQALGFGFGSFGGGGTGAQFSNTGSIPGFPADYGTSSDFWAGDPIMGSDSVFAPPADTGGGYSYSDYQANDPFAEYDFSSMFGG